MDVLRAIYGRRTAHQWVPGPIDEQTLLDLIDAAHQAPCHRLTWPWRFTVVGPITRKAIADIGVRCKQGDGPVLPEAQQVAVRSKMLDPSALVVVSRVLTDDAFQAREDYAALACAVQNFALAAHAQDLAVKWSTGAPTRHADTYALLGIDPDGQAIEGFLWLGTPRVVPVVKRPPSHTLVRSVP